MKSRAHSFASTASACSALEHGQVLQRLDAGVDHLGELARARAQPRVRGQQRRRRETLFEVGDDRHRLRRSACAAVVDRLSTGTWRDGFSAREGVGVLLAAVLDAGSPTRRSNGEALEVQRDAHAPRRAGSPVVVEDHLAATTRCSMRPKRSRPRGVAHLDRDRVADRHERRHRAARRRSSRSRAARPGTRRRGRGRRSRPCRCPGSCRR